MQEKLGQLSAPFTKDNGKSQESKRCLFGEKKNLICGEEQKGEKLHSNPSYSTVL